MLLIGATRRPAIQTAAVNDKFRALGVCLRSSSTERSPSPAKKEGVRLAWRAFAVNENAKDFTAQFSTPVQIDPKIFSLKTYAPQSLTAPCYSNHRTPLTAR